MTTDGSDDGTTAATTDGDGADAAAPAEDADDAAVVEAAATAAQRTIDARLDHGSLADVDVRVSFVDGELSIEVSLLPAEGADVSEADCRRVADDAALAARGAADDAVAARGGADDG